MSLTIFSQAFSVGFAPQFNSTPTKPQGSADPPQVELFGNVDGDYAELSTVKIISDDNDVSTDNQGFSNSDHKTQVRIDPESQKVIIEVVDDKTGREVRQIPGEQQLRLNEGISQYNDIAFNQTEDIELKETYDTTGKQPDLEQ